MTEPTVLDYFKSIFKDWRSFSAFVRAWANRADTAQMVEVAADVADAAPAAEPSSFILHPSSFPWRSLLALFLALFAQRMFEPPTQSAQLGVPFYLMAGALTLWAFRRGEWVPAPLPLAESRADPLTVRTGTFALSILFSGLAFVAMLQTPYAPGNVFTSLNLTLWTLAIFFHIRAFWLKEPQSLLKNVANFFTPSQWTPQKTRWTLLVLGVALFSIWFRFHQLNEVAPEMTSDHAEKLMDVYDVTNGQYSIFFTRNTGREPLYIYLSAFIAGFTGVSFLTIKIAAVLGGLLMLPYLYSLGKELGSERIGLLAVAFVGIAYWPGVIERFALRISFYPLFVAPTLYYLIRGLRRQQRNDFIRAGIALGLGLNGYTPFRIMPFAVVAIVIIYLLHVREKQIRKQTLLWLGLLALTSFVLFIPLASFATQNPELFGYRALSRLGSVERPLPGPVLDLFFGNLWNAMKEMNWNNGNIWVHSIPNRPALDIVGGALFLLGVTLVLARYFRSRHWADLVLLLAVPMTQMPSILSLAFPVENPSMNRTAGAIVPVFLIVAIGLDSLMTSLGTEKRRALLGWSLAGLLFVFSAVQSYNLIFVQYKEQYRLNAWNTREMGTVMTNFIRDQHNGDNIWIVPFAYWVDTRLPPLWAGLPGRDIALPRERLPSTTNIPGPKLFMIALGDVDTILLLQDTYPRGQLTQYDSAVDSHDFWVFFVPAQ